MLQPHPGAISVTDKAPGVIIDDVLFVRLHEDVRKQFTIAISNPCAHLPLYSVELKGKVVLLGFSIIVWYFNR